MMNVDKKLALRLLFVCLILFSFYQLGLPIELICLLGILFVGLILLRGKLWKTTGTIIENHLPFTKNWPGWSQKLVLILIFFIIYLAVKQTLFFVIGLTGIDLQQLISQALVPKSP